MLHRPKATAEVEYANQHLKLFRQKVLDDEEVRGESRGIIRGCSNLRTAVESGDPIAAVSAYLHAARKDPSLPIDPLLPIIFQLRGNAYTLEDHYMYAPLFRIFCMPKVLSVMAARQTGKTQNSSTSDVSLGAMIPHFNQLNVTPLYEQARRWSTNYVKPLMDGCVIPGMTQSIGRALENSAVLQRGFPNGSNILFSFAFLDCERVRGVAADKLNIDEAQGINANFIPIIRETLSASRFAFERYTFTPKTKDNTGAAIFEQSSQGFWTVRCHHCNHENIFDLDCEMRKAIGPDGPVCMKCSRDINPYPEHRGGHGYFVHLHPERKHFHLGYHIAQIVHPLHFAIKHKWADLREKAQTMPENQFENECLARPSDVGAKLITKDQLRAASVLDVRTVTQIRDIKHQYVAIATGTDWGGKGKKKATRAVADETDLEFISYTAFVVAGLKANGNIDILYMERMPYDADPAKEAQRSCYVYFNSGATFYAHDFTGAGNIRETLVLQYGYQKGLTEEVLLPMTLTGLSPSRSIVHFGAPGAVHQGARYSYSVDRTRLFFLMAFMIQKERIHFPKWEKSEHLVQDFLAWYEDTQETPRGAKVTRIMRDPDRPDDVAVAASLACAALWHSQQAWPDLTKHIGDYVSMTGERELEEAMPSHPLWSEEDMDQRI